MRNLSTTPVALVLIAAACVVLAILLREYNGLTAQHAETGRAYEMASAAPRWR